MNSVYESLQAFSRGQEPAAPLAMSWVVHDGMRGSTWTSLTADGALTTITIKPTRGPFVPQEPTELGRLSADEVRTFAAVLCAQRFDLLKAPPPSNPGAAQVELVVAVGNDRFSLMCPSSELAGVFGLAEIGRVFGELRKRFNA